LQTGWFWPLVLLALPNCALDRSGILGNLDPGPGPNNDAIMCDIEVFQGPGGHRCALAQDITDGLPLGSAAVALVTGQKKKIGLDYSPVAFAHCGDGMPEAIDFQDMFPDGSPVCVTCGQSKPADTPGVCVARCEDLVPTHEIQPPDKVAFCQASARPSTNFPKAGCFNGACSAGVFPAPGFKDPRQEAEPVTWDDTVNTSPGPNPNDLTKMTGSGAAFDAGAVSDQWIFNGDGYVEFEANENFLSHVIGLALVPPGCGKPADCHDVNPDYTDISFAISLNVNMKYYIFENGNPVTGNFDVTGAWGMYAAKQRFRVTVTDNHDGSYQVAYTYIDPMNPCIPGNTCNEQSIYSHSVPAMYPLRVDASFREIGASLINVTIVRIQP
jgi:hypothetical protein